MGIKGFINKITTKFKCIKKPSSVHTLCIDMNTILHGICHKSNDKFIFKKFLTKDLKKIIRMVKPTNYIAIFTDGQAVLAKAITQKKRRIKYLYGVPNGLTTLHLTTGTPFMDFVDKIIQEFLDNISKTLNIKTYYSPSTEKNEGELKLFEWLNRLNNTKRCPSNNNSKNIVVYGQDSDLVVLAIKSTQSNLYIINNYRYISINKLIRCIAFPLNSYFEFKDHPIKNDFTFLCMLLGNDYLPKICGFDNLWKAYIKLQNLPKYHYFLIKKNNTINFNNLKKLFNLMPNVPIKYKNTIQNSKNSNNYLQSLLWNYELYSGKVYPNYIPSNNIHIDLKTLIKHMPSNLQISQNDNNWNTTWIDSDVYLLMLMPLTGKSILPTQLQPYMENNSSIKDLYPEPCSQCIELKLKLKNLIMPNDNHTENQKNKLKHYASNTHNEYKNHLYDNHPYEELPIEKIKNALIMNR